MDGEGSRTPRLDEPGVFGVRTPRVKRARALLHRSERRERGLFLAEGPQAVREAIARPGTVVELFASAEAQVRHSLLIEQARDADLPVHTGDDRALASLSDTATPQGLVAVCRRLDVPLADALAQPPSLVALLAHARDPGNTGTVLRSADAAGAGLVVITEASVDVYNSKCVRASAGSLFHLPVAVEVSLIDAVQALRSAGLRVLAADGGGTRTLDQEVDAGGLAGPTAWIFGNEAWGLPAASAELADVTVRVPIYGQAESLNLATAAALCLYASARALRRRDHDVAFRGESTTLSNQGDTR